jgi:sugar phosphate isomerase/epimerase
MKISCSPFSLAHSFRAGEMDILRFVDFCAGQGLDGIDLLDSRSHPWCWAGNESQFQTVRERIQVAGLRLAAYGCVNNFAQSSDIEWRRTTEAVKNAVIEAAELGAPLLRIAGGLHPDLGGDPRIDAPRAFERILLGIDACLPFAEKHRVVLGIENGGRLPGHAWELGRIVRRFQSAFLQVVLDVGGFVAPDVDEAESPVAACEALRGHVAHVHVRDFTAPPEGARGGGAARPCPLGRGGVPLRQILARLDADAYAGFVSLRHESADALAEREEVPESLRFLRERRTVLGML